MKSAKLCDVGDLRIVDEPECDPAPGQIVVALRSVGVCGSDVHYYRQGRVGTQVAVYPQPLGHEPAGVVARAPAGSRFKEGDRVAVEPGVSCGVCEHCLAGFANRCPDVKFLASPGMPGAFAEELLVRQEQLEILPDSMSFDEGAMLEPLGVAYHAVTLGGLRPGDTVAIFGAGPIGLLTATVARAAGAGDIYMFDRLQYRLDFATQSRHTDHAVNVATVNPLEYLSDHTHGRGTDLSFEAAGEPDTFHNAVEAARIGGTVLLIGIPEVDTISLDPHSMRRRELLVRNVRRANRALARTMEMVRRGTVEVGSLATHHYGLEDIDQAFRTVAGYEDGVIRAMIAFGE